MNLFLNIIKSKFISSQVVPVNDLGVGNIRRWRNSPYSYDIKVQKAASKLSVNELGALWEVNMPVGEDMLRDSLHTDVPLSNISMDKNRNDLFFLKVVIFLWSLSSPKNMNFDLIAVLEKCYGNFVRLCSICLSFNLVAIFKCKRSLYVSAAWFLEKVRQDNHKQKVLKIKCDVYDE